jgi:hypothetical protein
MSELWYTDLMAKIDLNNPDQRAALEAFWNTTYKVNPDGTFALDDKGERIRTSRGKVQIRPSKGWYAHLCCGSCPSYACVHVGKGKGDKDQVAYILKFPNVTKRFQIMHEVDYATLEALNVIRLATATVWLRLIIEYRPTA